MVRLRSLRWGFAFLALIGARPVFADPITFTGFVENDFNPANPNVQVTAVSSDPTIVGPAKWITDRGWVSGWAIQDIRTAYDERSDTLYVGFNTFTNASGQKAIFGDADGNGDPGGADPLMARVLGSDDAHLGGHKSVAVAFAPDSTRGPIAPGTPVVIAGIPADKTLAGPGLDGFNVAAFKSPNLSLGFNFGKNLPLFQGELAYDPSAAHPGLEFTVKNFSKIPGIDPFKGFWITAYAGSSDDVVVGEAGLDFTRLPAFAPQGIPEPSTLLGWTLIAGAAALHWRRRQREAV